MGKLPLAAYTYAAMHYYEVLVADGSYKGSAALTYQFFTPLPVGSIVSVPLRSKQVLGVITKVVPKPTFSAKPLSPADGLQPLPPQLVALAIWIAQYYPAGIGVTMQQFLPSKLYKLDELGGLDTAPFRAASDAKSLPALTRAQAQAVETLRQPGTHILHGETGSGKTRVYIELVRESLEAGQSAIVMTPEIGLTPQLVNNFRQVFGSGSVILTHSKLTAKERNLAWLRMLQSQGPLVVLGPRSALFAPLRSIGTIVLDESHESSYKQEQAPHYHAATVAAKLASLHSATDATKAAKTGTSLVLGSATPSINEYYLAQAKQRPIVRMTSRATTDNANSADSAKVESPKVAIDIIDLKDRSQFSRQPHLSNTLLEAIQASIGRGEQSLVFLNRRGTARVMLCERCGWQSLCPHCDLPLTYHGDTHNVRCHTCGYHAPAANSCPECGSANIILKSIGTKAIVEELKKALPGARIQRFDTDNTKEERLEAHYDAVRSGSTDVIVGTQLIAKGLDLPKLSTVGVVVADTSLYLPDYTSGERSYQLLRQVIGRVGRGHIADEHSRVIIQTYEPDSPIINAAATGDWEGFYTSELAERRAFAFPPYVYTLKIWCRRASSAAAQAAAEKTVSLLRSSGLPIIVEGPSPAFYEKQAGKYQWQAVVKAKQRSQLIAAIGLLPANWSYDIDPSNLL